jgi:hypothetical protein
MAYIVIVTEGEAADVLHRTWLEKSNRLRTHTRSPGALVVYDTNLAREFVRDVKNHSTGGRLVVFRCEEPHDVIQTGDTA